MAHITRTSGGFRNRQRLTPEQIAAAQKAQEEAIKQAELDASRHIAKDKDPYEKWINVDLSDFSDMEIEKLLRSDDVLAVIKYKHSPIDKEIRTRVWFIDQPLPFNPELNELPLSELFILRVWLTDYVDNELFNTFWNSVNEYNTFPCRWPGYVTEILPMTFAGLMNLESVTVPDGRITKIGTKAFSGCRSLKSVYIGNSIRNLDKQTFYNCPNLTTVNLSENIVRIPPMCFAQSGVKNLDFIDGVTTIEKMAFAYCYNLTDIVIPYSVEKIDSGAFFSCDNLKSINILNPNILIDPSAFNDCDKLESLVCAGEEML